MPLAVVRVAAGSTSVATAAISDRRPSAKPYAMLGRTTSTSGFTTSATHTNDQVDTTLTTSVTYAASRILRVMIATEVYSSGGLQNVILSIQRGSTTVAERFFASEGFSTSNQNAVTIVHTFSGPVAGTTENFNLLIRAGSLNTAVNSYATAAQIKMLTVEDLGPQ